MPRRLEPGYWRAASLAAALLMSAPILSACSALAPTKEEIQTEDSAAKYAQAMRMAANVRSGGDMGAAATFYQRAHALDPKKEDPLIGLAETAAAAGAKEQAIEYLRQAIALAPNNAAARRSYGTLLLSGGAPEQALETFRSVVEKDPQDHRSFNGMGVALDLLGRQTEAQQAYRQGLKIAPLSSSLRNNLALSLAISGDRQQALDLLHKLAADPGAGPRIRQNLALVYALDNDLQQAVAIASRDLSQTELRNNIILYRALPTMSAPEMASTVFGIGRTSAVAARKVVVAEHKTDAADEISPSVREAQASPELGSNSSPHRQSPSPQQAPAAAIAGPPPQEAMPAADFSSVTAKNVPATGDAMGSSVITTQAPKLAAAQRRSEPSIAAPTLPPVTKDDAGPIVSFAGSEQPSEVAPTPFSAERSKAAVTEAVTASPSDNNDKAVLALSPRQETAATPATADSSRSRQPGAVTMPEQPVVQPQPPSSAIAPALAAATSGVSDEVPPPTAVSGGVRGKSNGLQSHLGSPGGPSVIGGLGMSLIEPVASNAARARPSIPAPRDTDGTSVSERPGPQQGNSDPLLTPEPIGRLGM